jgi:hypothetical protein
MDGIFQVAPPQLQKTAAQLHALLPGVPHIESPFFEDFFALPNVDEKTRSIALELHTKGYAVIDFPDHDILALAESIKQNLQSRFDFAAWKQAEASFSLRIENAWEFDDNVKRIACNEEIVQLLSTLYGAAAWPFPVGTQQHFHTDSVHFSSMPERFMCGVWVALEDIDDDNGPLEYYPGSHAWPLFTNEHIGYCVSATKGEVNQGLYEEMWRALVEKKQAKPARFHAKKGQALIWAANLMHGGAKHLNKDRTRWSQVTHYFFEKCAYYTPMFSDPFYGQIAFRQLTNIKTGKIMPNMYVGNEIRLPNDEMKVLMTELARDGFDAQLYLQANPDVAESGVNPYEHFLKFGYKESRRLKP